MLIGTSLRELSLQEVPRAARLAEELDFDELTFSEVRQDPFIVATLAATSTERIRLATGVAIAFPRSPMIVAYAARNLQELSNGRFTLGLGTQVKAHITGRFSAPWGSPGPHLREYVFALRAIWDCWQHRAPLDFRGEYYSFTLMTPEFDLGPAPYPMRLQLAAVNPYNIRLAAAACDGLRVHSFCTPAYLRDQIWPNLRQGANQAGRDLRASGGVAGGAFTVVAGGFIATGRTEADVQAAREKIRYRVAHYASTRAYRPVLEHHGWGALYTGLRQMIAEGRWGDLAELVTDEVLDEFCVAGTYQVIADRVHRRLGGLVDELILPFSEDAAHDGDYLIGALHDLKQIPTASALGHPA